jgi:hypothetical protein
MTNFTKFLASTAVAALIALPASALTIESTTALDLSLDTNPCMTNFEAQDAQRDGGVSATQSGGVNNTTVEAAEPEGTDRGQTLGGGGSTDTMIAAPAMVDPEFEGDVVMTSDNVAVGIVESVFDNGDGQQKLVVALDRDVLAGSVDRISFVVDGNAKSDGEIMLNFDKSQFEEEVNKKAEASVDTKS